MQDNLIYEIEDFWENLHVTYSESETSSESFHKQDSVISPRDWVSCDLNHDRVFSLKVLFSRF